MTEIKISSRFDSGNIEVLDGTDPAALRLAIRADTGGSADAYMWFHFLVTGARDRECCFRIENAGGSRWATGWNDYRLVGSYDRQEWFRIPGTFDGQSFAWQHRPDRDRVWYGYHAPYPESRRQLLLERCAANRRARVEVLGETPDGRDLEMVVVGEPGPGKSICWVLARQHPGETQAEFAAEYLVDRLIDDADPISRALLARAVFHVVPNMNPDGSARGHHRANAHGIDLNRAWSDTTPEKSPEVWYVRERMRRTGVDFCIDFHGDERQPFVWPVGTPGIPSVTEHQLKLRTAFDRALVRANPDYRPDKPDKKVDHKPGADPVAMCTSWAAENFGCLALIIELPFLDNADAPDPLHGWSPRRSGLFGAACLDALASIIDDLR